MSSLPFFHLVADDLRQVEALLRAQEANPHPAIAGAVDHLLGSGGKRLRPALVLLSSHLCGADPSAALFAAAGVEMLHTATLVHDDLIDGSLMRRGAETLNARWSPAATVLTGDYLFARAAYLVARTANVRLVQRFAETLMVICNGEIRQMFDGRDRVPTFQEYEQRIYAKTASLIALSAEAGAILAHADEDTISALHRYGERLGLAFQVVDDILDFVADEQTLGKPVGSDLRQGLITLPVMLFLEDSHDHPTLQRLRHGPLSEDAVQEAVRTVAASPAIDRSLQVARGYIREAKETLQSLPPSDYRDALLDLADFVTRRQF
ncbi:MAG: polyprenyl synthetase family protein [Anaerolineae bacterium]|nr:polyprenyl synthetase family protein [Anaerolineae bacterium]MDW8069515.1 polyprenyl synthetase family protein [Anaerolineae bacterium]